MRHRLWITQKAIIRDDGEAVAVNLSCSRQIHLSYISEPKTTGWTATAAMR